MPNIIANWPAPKTIRAITTTRRHGFSKPPYAAHNLGLHVGDDLAAVLANRELLKSSLQLPGEPQWLAQTHSNCCVVVDDDPNRKADAAITRQLQYPLVIQTADCLPIVLCNKQGSEIAAIHAGWRGLVNGIIDNTLNKMHSKPADILAWIGPAICQNCYEVGDEVFQACQLHYPTAMHVFRRQANKWRANLPQLAEFILNRWGLTAIYQSKKCTFEQQNEFYSYRREPQTGRIATLIWFMNKS